MGVNQLGGLMTVLDFAPSGVKCHPPLPRCWAQHPWVLQSFASSFLTHRGMPWSLLTRDSQTRRQEVRGVPQVSRPRSGTLLCGSRSGLRAQPMPARATWSETQYEKSHLPCLSLPHLPLLQPACCQSCGALLPSLVTSILNAESQAQEMKRISLRGTCAIFQPLPPPPLPRLHPPCPSFPWLVVARGHWCWQGTAGFLAGFPGQPARLFRAHSCFPEAGSAEQETGCLGRLTVSKH